MFRRCEALWAVHPHGRGDNYAKHAWHDVLGGSPPRAWGQCLARALMPRERRFTPTGVGTMRQAAVSVGSVPVHPHGRGDNLPVTLMVVGFVGSPPRAWGQCDSASLGARSARFTPTGVGTMVSHGGAEVARPVHPHGRGDNLAQALRAYGDCGSPPRAWGQSCVSGILMRFASKNKPRSHVPHQDGILTRKSPSTCMS